MATQVQVPALGESVTQATLIKWHKSDGQNVSADEPLCELETDKANVDVPAPSAGVVRHVKEEGDTVGVGEVIARIDESGNGNPPAPAPVPAPAVPPPALAPAAPRDDLSPSVR